MINQEQIAAYREMAKNAGENSMEAQIRENLERTCEKFAGNEDKFERCISYLVECAKNILEGKNGDVPDDVCFRICRDYFNDEIWKAEDEERAAKNEAKKKAAEEKKAAAAAKKAELARKKAEAAAIKKTAAEARKAETLARKKDEEERKAADEQKKSEEARKADMCHGQLNFFSIIGV